MNSDQFDDPRVPLASERTLLAWIRTALAMMGLGSVVARFGLFLQEIREVSSPLPTPPSSGMSLWIGFGLVTMGTVVTLLAATQHVRFLDRLKRGEPYCSRRWSLGVGVAIAITAIGAMMAAYLILLSK